VHADLDELAGIDGANYYMIAVFRKAQGSLVPALRESGYATAAFVDGGWMDERCELGVEDHRP
jgi:hypothetical protein